MDIVGENAVLLAGMGYVYFQFRNTGIKMDEETLQKAEDYSKQALLLDPESSTAHVVIALLRVWNGKPREVIDHFKKALTSDPNYFDAIFWYIAYCVFLGKIKEITKLLQSILRVEPLNPMTSVDYAMVCFGEGKLEMAVNIMRDAYRNYPDDILVRFFYSLALLWCNLLEEADLIINQFIKDSPEDMNAKMVFAMSLAFRPDTATALKILKDPKMEAWARPDLFASFFISEAFALNDLKNESFDWLENAVNLGVSNYPLLNEYDPLLKNIRGEERFKKLMERVKYEWENFEV